MSFDAVARTAGVAERTVYRHFPTRERLLSACWAWLNEQVGLIRVPTTEAELLSAVPRLFEQFDRHAPLMRAYLSSPVGHEVRRSVAAQRQQDLEHILADALRGRPAPERRRAVAVVQALVSAPT